MERIVITDGSGAVLLDFKFKSESWFAVGGELSNDLIYPGEVILPGGCEVSIHGA